MCSLCPSCPLPKARQLPAKVNLFFSNAAMELAFLQQKLIHTVAASTFLLVSIVLLGVVVGSWYWLGFIPGVINPGLNGALGIPPVPTLGIYASIIACFVVVLVSGLVSDLTASVLPSANSPLSATVRLTHPLPPFFPPRYLPCSSLPRPRPGQSAGPMNGICPSGISPATFPRE